MLIAQFCDGAPRLLTASLAERVWYELSAAYETLVSMKKFLRVMLVLIGIGAVIYVVTQRQTEARQLWNEALAKVPSPGCCGGCRSEAEDDEEPAE